MLRVTAVFVCLAACLRCVTPALPAQETQRVVAVTSFANLNKDPAQDWLSTGIGETLTVKLAQVPSLVVVERMRLAEVMKELQLQDTAVVEADTAAKIGKLVGAQTIVVGAIQKAADQLRITARFVEVETGKISNTAQADGTMKDIFSLQDRLADALLASLNVKVDAETDAKMRARPTESIEAYEAYSKGISSMNAGDYSKAAEELKRATDKDPGFQLAQDALQFVEWARPNARSAVWLAKLNVPFDKVYDAMLKVVKSGAGECKFHSEDRQAGKIEAKTSWNWKTAGQDIEINFKSIGNVTGINILSQTRRGIFGIRQMIDWGESKKSIDRLLRAFYAEMGISQRP